MQRTTLVEKLRRFGREPGKALSSVPASPPGWCAPCGRLVTGLTFVDAREERRGV